VNSPASNEPAAALKVGVISDTHDFFDPRIPSFFKGVGHILHGGDIGLPRILHQLEKIAPVTAVMGNTDDPGLGYRLTECLELAGKKFLLHHIVNPYALTEPLAQAMRRERPHVVIFGHTHKASSEIINGVLFFNPGYAGRIKPGMERSLAILHCADGRITHEYLPL
jgi:putative phosphoesterase